MSNPKPPHELLRDAWFGFNLAEKRLWKVIADVPEHARDDASALEEDVRKLRQRILPLFQAALREHEAKEVQLKNFQKFLVWFAEALK